MPLLQILGLLWVTLWDPLEHHLASIRFSREPQIHQKGPRVLPARRWQVWDVLLEVLLVPFLMSFFQILVENGRQMPPPKNEAGEHFWPPKNGPKTEPQFFMDLASILVAILVIF